MKKIIFMILVVATTILSQQPRYNFGKYATYYSGGISYNGTELITNAIDRTLEPVSIYTSNFTAGVNSWLDIWGTISGNVDGIFGQDNVARILADGSGAYTFVSNASITANVRYAGSVLYYVQAAGSATYINLMVGSTEVIALGAPTKGAWTLGRGNVIGNSTQGRMNFGTPAVGDSVYFRDFNLSKIANINTAGNHSTSDTSSVYKQGGSYSGKLISTGAGNGTTNTFSLASTLFTAVTNGLNYRFQVYAYTSTANTTLTFKLGDIVKTAIVSTSGMSVINFDFKATASTTGNIYLYLDKAATVYLDNASLKSGQ